MTNNLNDIWRNAQMWPTESISLVAQIQVNQDEVRNMRDGVSDYASSPYEGKKIRQSDDWKTISVGALNALSYSPDTNTATSTYNALSSGYLSPFATADFTNTIINPVINGWSDAARNAIMSSFLQYIIERSPNIIAVHNGMFFLEYLQTSIDTDLVVAVGLKTNPCLADQACRLIEKTLPKGEEKERIIFSLVKVGTDTTTGILLGNTTRQSDRAIKDFILKILFADPWPHGYVIEDYIDYLEYYIEKGDLLSAISAAEPDAALISGTLEVYTHLVRGLKLGVMGEDADDNEEETEILFRLIDHLVGRELSIPEMEHLSEIYNEVFYWTIIADPEWLKKKEKGQEAAQKIHEVYEHAPNKAKIDAALYSTDSGGFYTAFEIITNIYENDAFEIIFEATKNASHPRHLDLLAKQVENEDQARKALDWVIARFRISEDGYGGAFSAPGFNGTSHALIRVAGEYPGLGGPLILAGLNFATTAHDAAAEALMKWPLSHWPDDALGKLNQAVKNTERTLGLLNEALTMHSAANSDQLE